jgi:hypothetical protein
VRFYVFDQDLLVRNAATLGSLPDTLDPLACIQGTALAAPPSPLRLRLSEAGGDTPGDIVQPFATVYSDRLCRALTDFGVDNVQLFPVELEHPRTGRVVSDYRLANIVGRVACVDLPNSTYRRSRSGKGLHLEGFQIDEARAPKQPIFRLDEQATLVLVNEALKQHLEGAGLTGVRLLPTEEFDGD